MKVIGTLFKHLIRWPLEALLFYAVAGVFMILPVAMASALGGAITRLIAPLTPFHRRSLFNIGYAMPALPQAERKRIIMDMWWHIGRVLGEYLHTKALIESDRITIHGAEHIQQLQEKGGFLITGHIGNWELSFAPLVELDRGINIVFRRINNPYISKLLNRRVRIFNAAYEKGLEGARGMAKSVKKGDVFIALVDQKLREGEMLDFFGHKASTAIAHIKLAMKFDVPIILSQVVRRSGCKFDLYIQPLDLSPFDPSDKDVTKKIGTHINSILEDWIRKHPEQWLWPHRRWPASKGETYTPPKDD